MGLCFAMFVFLTFRGPLALHDSNPYPNRSRIARYNATKFVSFTRKTLFSPKKGHFGFCFLCLPLFLFSLSWASPFLNFSVFVSLLSFSFFCFSFLYLVLAFSFCVVCFLFQDVFFVSACCLALFWIIIFHLFFLGILCSSVVVFFLVFVAFVFLDLWKPIKNNLW